MRAWTAVPMIVASLAVEPPRFNVRIAIDPSRATPSMHALAIDALQHGMFDDSVIVAAPPPTDREIQNDRDHTKIVLLRGRIAAKADSAAVCLAVYDVLLRPLTGPDSFTVAIAELRSGLTAAGRRIATHLADRQPSQVRGRPCV